MLEVILFAIFALATAGGALMVVLSQNVARMAFWLIISLGSVAGLFFLLGADFVGAAQLLIYVGGTVVLLIFGVMLTGSGPYLQIKTNPGEVMQAGLVGLLLFGLLVFSVLQVNWDRSESVLTARYGTSPVAHRGYNPEIEGGTVRKVGAALLGARFDQDLDKPAGSPLSSGFLLPFEIVSIHLLVVLIGASYLARAKRRVEAGTGDSSAAGTRTTQM